MFNIPSNQITLNIDKENKAEGKKPYNIAKGHNIENSGSHPQ